LVRKVAQIAVDRVGAGSLTLPSTTESSLSRLRRNRRSHLGGLRRRGSPSCRNDLHNLRAADSRGEALLDSLHHLSDRFMGLCVDLVQVLAKSVHQAGALLAYPREGEVTIRLFGVGAGVLIHLVDEAIDHVPRLLGSYLIARLAAAISVRK